MEMNPTWYSTAHLLLTRNVSPNVYEHFADGRSSSHSRRCKHRRSCQDVRIVDAATGDLLHQQA